MFGLMALAGKSGKLTAITDGRAAVLNTDASIICVGTPNSRDGSLDLSAVRQTAELISRAMAEKMERHVVILRSTVPAGTCENLLLPALHPDNTHASMFDCDLVIVPEFLREGCAIADYYDPPFIVVGSAAGKSDNNEPVIQALFGGVTDRLQWLPFREAEMLKATCNVFHALKVAFANVQYGFDPHDECTNHLKRCNGNNRVWPAGFHRASAWWRRNCQPAKQ